jgi:hypothetical protein
MLYLGIALGAFVVQGENMSRKNKKHNSDHTSRAGIEALLAEPRMSRSARIAEIKLDKTRFVEPASTTVPGTVEEIIPPQSPKSLEKAQIALDGDGKKYSKLRIENILIDEHGDDVSLTKGAHVQVTVAELGANKKLRKT